MAGATLGIIGYGRIGRAVAQRDAAFGMRIIHTGREGGVSVDELLAKADVVSLHCPLTAQTAGMIERDRLASMKPGAILINTARGGLVDTSALKTGRLAAAGLDVTDPEPLRSDHPLLACPTALVAPHIGSATNAARERMAEIAVNNLLAGLAEKPLPFAAQSR